MRPSLPPPDWNELISFLKIIQTLQWMIPAPAQGAMVVMTMDENEFCLKGASSIE